MGPACQSPRTLASGPLSVARAAGWTGQLRIGDRPTTQRVPGHDGDPEVAPTTPLTAGNPPQVTVTLLPPQGSGPAGGGPEASGGLVSIGVIVTGDAFAATIVGPATASQ